MANGEVERSHTHGFLNDDKKPGRKRPKVGDKDPNWKPKKKRPNPTPSKPETPKPKDGLNYNHRDYRGTRGAIDDADPPSSKKK